MPTKPLRAPSVRKSAHTSTENSVDEREEKSIVPMTANASPADSMNLPVAARYTKAIRHTTVTITTVTIKLNAKYASVTVCFRTGETRQSRICPLHLSCTMTEFALKETVIHATPSTPATIQLSTKARTPSSGTGIPSGKNPATVSA